MFDQKVLIGALIIAVINFVTGYLWYDVLMGDYFPTMEGANRIPVAFPAIIAGVLIFSYAFARLFKLIQNPEEPLMGQAIRFGFLIALLTAVAYSLFTYSGMQIWTSTHFIVDALFNTIMSIIMAVVLAKYYGPMPSRGGLKGGGRD